jgi:hypothetical protein
MSKLYILLLNVNWLEWQTVLDVLVMFGVMYVTDMLHFRHTSCIHINSEFYHHLTAFIQMNNSILGSKYMRKTKWPILDNVFNRGVIDTLCNEIHTPAYQSWCHPGNVRDGYMAWHPLILIKGWPIIAKVVPQATWYHIGIPFSVTEYRKMCVDHLYVIQK